MGAQIVGYNNKFFETVHGPHTWKVDIQNLFYSNNPELLKKNIKFRFRNSEQFEPSSLFAHLAIKKKLAIIKTDADSLMIIPNKGGLIRDKLKFEIIKTRDPKIKFLCFQDLYMLEQENLNDFKEVVQWLDKIIFSE
jgi:hypothetical protein